MTNFITDRMSFSPSIETDDLRPALLMTGVQVVVALVGAVLLTNGLLA